MWSVHQNAGIGGQMAITSTTTQIQQINEKQQRRLFFFWTSTRFFGLFVKTLENALINKGNH